MRIPSDAIIQAKKLTDYLLTPRPKNDKSQFLAQVGFTRDNPGLLEQAIRKLIAENDAELDGQNEYGIFYRVTGVLVGPRGNLATVTVWIQLTNQHLYRFITLKPVR